MFIFSWLSSKLLTSMKIKNMIKSLSHY